MLLIVLEGVNDIAFMRTVSTILHRHNAALPDLAELEIQRKVLFLPTGGANLKDWVQRIGSLHRPEFHLYDRELEPVTSERRQIINAINQRPDCRAVLTSKRALENYLHPAAIYQACDIDITFTDDTDVPNLLAQHLYARHGGRLWAQLPNRGQRRLRAKAKKLLNFRAVTFMTPELLGHEVIGWLQSINNLVSQP